jgi:hypothetical protein
MGKDLRTLPVSLKVHRQARIDGTPWGLTQLQPFFPPLETLFKTERVSNIQEVGVRVSDPLESIVDATQVRLSKGRVVPVHRKTTMILSPFKWMRGDYMGLGLPKPESVASDLQSTLQSPHTAGYVGALASIVLSESGCPHFPKVYGVYTGLATKHTLDISDDYEDLSERPWFGGNLGTTFELTLRQSTPTGPAFTHTRSQRPSVQMGQEDVDLGDMLIDVAADHISEPSTRSQSHSHREDSTDSEYLEDEESSDDEDEFDINSCDCSEASSDDGDGEGDADPFAWATFKDVPVITTVMEQCVGTFYDLLEAHSEPERHAAWVAQIVFALAFAQRSYGFTHNDLHGNNVMYTKTDQEFLYYNHGGQCYRVPTYGVLIKLIDFDRACLSVRLQGMKDPRHFVSSQFRIDDEAAGQYNIEPFFVQTHPRIPLNPSFDLCRFATSVYWDLFPEGPDVPTGHPLQDVFHAWMTQTDGSSVFFREKKDRHDRYHGFDLYKAIARYCKDSATPRRELAKLLAFQIPTIPLGAPCLFLEASA